MSKYVKFKTEIPGVCDLTKGKAYEVIEGSEDIIDDDGVRIEIMTPNWSSGCAHLYDGQWVWCDESGVEL